MHAYIHVLYYVRTVMQHNMGFHGKMMETYCLHVGKRLQNTLEKTPYLMGKSTILTGTWL